MKAVNNKSGKIIRISGPVVGVSGLEGVRLHDMVLVGEAKLIGEVIRMSGQQATIQVYEETSGLKMGEPITGTGHPLIAHLGPGLMGQIFDGLQRPLNKLADIEGDFLKKGVTEDSLPRDKRWKFTPFVKEGDFIKPGNLLGEVPETQSIIHRVMVPPQLSGRVVEVHDGELTLTQPVAVIEDETGRIINIGMEHVWPVRSPRPYKRRLDLAEPLVTGKRVIDMFFPIPKGGSAIIPGGFGTGKTVIQQSLARWSDVDVVVYVGCGERGNEMAEVLMELPELEDRVKGIPLINRTILIANTSNMPVAAREASIYLGITIAEYYRDMGYDVLMLADSTSRWGEALREVSGRLEEIPGEEGYPAYLSSRLAEFYERAGHVDCLGNGEDKPYAGHREGSVSLVGAVSPPGGDFSDPITQSSMRIAGVFWALDYDLSRKRHFPAINWIKSFSLVDLSRWFGDNVEEDFPKLVQEAKLLLGRENELLQVVQLIGQDALSDLEREILIISKLLREDFLQQSSIQDVDTYCSLEKSYWMLKVILNYHQKAQSALNVGIDLSEITNLAVLQRIARMKEIPIEKSVPELKRLVGKINDAFDSLIANWETENA
ncbi:MAG: V-type ATP synthase subunit A [Anaerolineaceae bacterium]|jgi:V/A-type H+-transporting ATPase subunit A|nr:MAG: V-type ATP synthase subunit A [Anaerolineaceae bacterium]